MLGSLVVRLGLDAADFIQGIGKSDQLAKKFAKGIDADFTAAARSLGVLAAGFGTTAGAVALFVRSQANAIDALNDVADATGASIENLSALEDVARKNGGSLDTATDALVKFNQQLGAVDGKNDASRALQMLGLDAQALKREDPAEALRQTAVAIAQFADDGDKARIVQELFGKSIREAGPFLKDLSEQTRLQGAQTTEAAAQAERFNKNLFELQTLAGDAGRAIANQLIPPINQFVATLKSDGIAKALGLDTLQGSFSQIVDGYRLIGLARERALKTQALEKDPGNERLLKDLAAIDAKARELAGSFNAARTAYLGIGSGPNAGAGRGFVNPPVARPSLGPLAAAPGKAAGDSKSEAQRYLESLEKQLQRVNDLTAAETVLADIQSGRLKLSGDVTREALLGVAVQIDAAKAFEQSQREAQQQTDEFIKAQEKELQGYRDLQKAAEDRLSSLLQNTPSEVLKREQDDIEFLRQAYYDARITVDQYGEAVAIVMGKAAQDTKDANDVARSLGLTFSSAFEDAVVEGKKLSDVIGGIEKDLIRLAARKLITEPVGKWFEDTLGGKSSGGGNLIGSFLSSIFGGPKAIGGPTMPNTLYQVGERQPEVFSDGSRQYLLTGSRRGYIDPRPAASGGRSVVVNTSINVPGNTDRRTALQIGAEVARQVSYANARMS